MGPVKINLYLFKSNNIECGFCRMENLLLLIISESIGLNKYSFVYSNMRVSWGYNQEKIGFEQGRL